METKISGDMIRPLYFYNKLIENEDNHSEEYVNKYFNSLSSCNKGISISILLNSLYKNDIDFTVSNGYNEKNNFDNIIIHTKNDMVNEKNSYYITKYHLFNFTKVNEDEYKINVLV